MMRRSYENDLNELHIEIIKMVSLIERAIEDSVRAFEQNDLALCEAIIDQDKTIDDLEKSIESKCLWLIAREQPVASDLKKITTGLKMITDMERIGDHAADIAALTLRLSVRNSFADSGHIPQMAEIAVSMVHDAVTSYINTDLELSKETRRRDDDVDEYFNVIKRELVSVFRSNEDAIDNAIDFLLIAKYLERIADHAVNICEWVEFSVTGKHKDAKVF
ncbi:MAG: phosphate signaling complex protein PhoU [Clostridiales Family XIII bacterium]|jgi:phosphate transport system protein|nr:phosphate signaling complex protein PhoU [Clostridiales Family XIII bacterium]